MADSLTMPGNPSQPPQTTRSKLILIGGGGHAKVVLDSLSPTDRARLAGFLDDDPAAGLLDMPDAPAHLGPLAEMDRLGDTQLIIAIGDLRLRRRLIDQLTHAAFCPAVVHRSAVISASATLGAGVLVGPGAIINAGARAGNHAIINSGAIIEHDCVLGVNTHIAPGATLGGGVRVGEHTLVGLGSTVLPGITIGTGCTIGAGSVVTRDVEDGATVAGVPGRVWVRQ